MEFEMRNIYIASVLTLASAITLTTRLFAQDDGVRYRYLPIYSPDWHENGGGGNFVSDQGQIFESKNDFPGNISGRGIHRLGVCEDPSGSLDLNRGFMECGEVRNLNLADRDLRGRYPVGVLVTNTNMARVDLRHANLHEAFLLNTNLYQANLLSANLHYSYWVNVRAPQAIFGLSNFYVTMKHNSTADEEFANMRGAKFNSAKVRMKATQIDLSGADFYRVGNSTFALTNPVQNYLEGYRVILDGAGFNEAKIKLTLEQGNISGYMLDSSAKNLIAKNADLSGSSFRYVDLSGSNFSNTILDSSAFITHTFRYGYPVRVYPKITNLSGSNFQGASLKTSTFIANYSHHDHRFLPATNSNFRNANFQFARLKHVDLSNSDLTNADLRNALLCKVEARSANLSGAKLSGAMITNDTALPFSLDEARARGAVIISHDASICAFER